MLGTKSVNETDQLTIIAGDDTYYSEDIFYPSEEDISYFGQNIEICLSNLKKSENTDFTLEEGYQVCSMVCGEDPNADICSAIIESDNQVI